MRTVLLVGADPSEAGNVSGALEDVGYRVRCASDLRAAQALEARERIDVVLVARALPDGDGLSFVERLRENGSRLPLIVLGGPDDGERAAVEALQAGANDYLRRPMGVLEIVARVRAALHEPMRRDPQVRVGAITLLPEQRRAYAEGREIPLNRREFDLLCFLARCAGRVVGRDVLLHALPRGAEIFDRTIDSHLSHLRRRLAQAGVTTPRIKAVYGVGYQLEVS